jgi:hypothetical protein
MGVNTKFASKTYNKTVVEQKFDKPKDVERKKEWDLLVRSWSKQSGLFVFFDTPLFDLAKEKYNARARSSEAKALKEFDVPWAALPSTINDAIKGRVECTMDHAKLVNAANLIRHVGCHLGIQYSHVTGKTYEDIKKFITK